MQTYRILLERLKQGEFPVGTRLASERGLAEELQVSRTAVRQAISRLAGEGWLEVKSGFRPVVRANPVVQTRSGTYALLMGSEGTYRPFAQILRGCEMEIRKRGHLLVFMDTWAETSHSAAERGIREQETLDYMMERGMDGLILWPQETGSVMSRLPSLQRNNIRVVTIDREVPGAAFDHVGIDNFRASRLVVDYLVRANHRNIVFATEHTDHATSVQQRVEGFQFAMQGHHLDGSNASLFRFPFRATPDQIATELRQRKEVGKMPTAIFAVNDLFAWRVIRALRLLELGVPKDVSVIGFDDNEPPPADEGVLTTVRQPFTEIGRIAVQTLLQRRNEPEALPRQILLPTTLMERSSVRTLEDRS